MSNKATINGLFWNGAESAILQTVQLLVSMVLARLLTASDFGLIALISVFISIANALVQGGFQSAIIVFHDLNDIDCSTAFVYNLVASVFIYFILFFSAPYIANFYNETHLISLIRVLSLVNIIQAGYFVQDAMLQRQMRFKLLAQRNIIASIISGAIAILMAYFGAGVWSLVSLTISRAVVINIYLWFKSVWKFSLKFSFNSFKKSFSFGSRMMATIVTGVIFNNLNSLLIGKFYTKADLGYYYQAKKLRDVPVESASGVLTKTSKPLLAGSKTEITALHNNYFNIIKISSITIIPLVTLLFVTGRELITVVFSSRWLNAVPIFRIIILSGLFTPFIVVNGLSPIVMGDSKYYLKLDTIMKIVFLAITFAALQFGLLVFIASQTITAFLQMIVNAFVARKFYKVGIKKQINIYLPHYIYCVIAGFLTWCLGYIPGIAPIIKLILSIVIFVSLYGSMVYIFERKTFNDVIKLIHSSVNKLKLKTNQQVAEKAVTV